MCPSYGLISVEECVFFFSDMVWMFQRLQTQGMFPVTLVTAKHVDIKEYEHVVPAQSVVVAMFAFLALCAEAHQPGRRGCVEVFMYVDKVRPECVWYSDNSSNGSRQNSIEAELMTVDSYSSRVQVYTPRKVANTTLRTPYFTLIARPRAKAD